MTEKSQNSPKGPKQVLIKKKSKAFLGDKQSTSSSDDISTAAKSLQDSSAETITQSQMELYNAKMCLEQEDMEHERLLAHFREVQRARIDQDLVNLAGTYLNRIFSEKLTEVERLAIESWLSGRLEDERKSWKKLLGTYTKEVEKERKMAQDSHDKADFLRSKLEYFLSQYGLSPEDSYIAAELDTKTRNASLINNYLEVLGQTLQIYQCERSGIVQMLIEEEVLDESEQTMQLTDFLKKRLKFIGDSIRLRDIKLQELETTITANLKSYTDDISRLQKDYKDKERVHTLTIKTLTTKLQDLTSIESLLTVSSTAKDTSSLVDSCTQTDTTYKSHDSTFRKLFHAAPDNAGSTQTNSSKPKLLVGGTTVKVCVAYQLPELTDRDGEIVNHHDLENPGSNEDPNQDFTLKSTDLIDVENQHTLQKAHSDGYLYKSNLLAAAEKIRDEGTRYKDGYLSGTRKEIISSNSLARTTELILRRVKQRKSSIEPTRLSPNKNRCLLCHKLYNLRDNHKMACRFHPKAKRKMEKYDNKGRLILVTYIWECCLQHAEASGCTTGEHV